MNTAPAFKNARIIGTGVDPAAYHRSNGDCKRGDPSFIMSRSQLGSLLTNPLKWFLGAAEESSTSTEWGDLIDTMALDPNRFDEKFTVTPETYPDGKTGEPKDWNWNANYCKEWKKSIGKRLPIKPDMLKEADVAIKRLRENPNIAELIDCSQKQVFIMAEYADPSTGITIPLKALVDLLPDKAHPKYGTSGADFKTCRSAAPRAWAKHVFEYGYDMQGALYLDLIVAATHTQRATWYHPVQENTPPFITDTHILSEEYLIIGRSRYIRALKLYCRCLAEKKWPSYDFTGLLINGAWKCCEPEVWMNTAAMDHRSLDEIFGTTVERTEKPKEESMPC